MSFLFYMYVFFSVMMMTMASKDDNTIKLQHLEIVVAKEGTENKFIELFSFIYYRALYDSI